MNYLSLLLLLAFFSCSKDYLNINSTNEKIVKIAKKEYGLDAFGIGVAAPNKIKKFLLSFSIKGKYNNVKARELIINFVEDIISIVKDPVVISNLESPPFDSKNLRIMITFEDDKGDLQEDLSGICLDYNEICFIKDVNDSLTTIETETYSEAYFKVYGTYPPERGNN